MSDNTALVPVNLNQLPSTQLGTDEQFADLAKGSDFLGRLQLFTKSKVNQQGLIPQGHYGIKESEEEIIDLGTSVDILPLARRPKAIDMRDMQAIVVSYDRASKTFQDIEERTKTPNSHCQAGISFLVYERSTGRFLEFFCGNTSALREAKRLFPYLPITEAGIQARAAAGEDVSGLEPRDPVPVTLRTKLVENRYGAWHAPLVTKCSTPFAKVPSEEAICKQIVAFLTVKDNGVERVEEEAGSGRVR
jgi:hypothetical protein